METNYKPRLVCYYRKANGKVYWAMIWDEAPSDDHTTKWEISDFTQSSRFRHWIDVPTYHLFPAHKWESIQADPKLKQEYENTLMEQVNKDKSITITAEQRDAIKEVANAIKGLNDSMIVKRDVTSSLTRLLNAAEKLTALKCDEI